MRYTYRQEALEPRFVQSVPRASLRTPHATCRMHSRACATTMSHALDLACTASPAGPLRPTTPHIRQHTCSIGQHTSAYTGAVTRLFLKKRVSSRVDPSSPVVRQVTGSRYYFSLIELLGLCLVSLSVVLLGSQCADTSERVLSAQVSAVSVVISRGQSRLRLGR